MRVARTGASPGVVNAKTTLITSDEQQSVGSALPAPDPTRHPDPRRPSRESGQADVNHSLEYPTSTTALTGIFIDPGTFIRSVVGTTVTLSRPTIAAAVGTVPNCPNPPLISAAASVPRSSFCSPTTPDETPETAC